MRAFKIILSGLAVLVAVFVIVGNWPGPPPTAAQEAIEAQRRIATAGALKLRDSMRNPRSFEVVSARTTAAGVICYVYRAQNGLGGTDVERALVKDGHLQPESFLAPEQFERLCAPGAGTDLTDAVQYDLSH